MRVLVISDLHLGAPSRIAGADQKLISVLLLGWDKVVIAGDLFELWESSLAEIAEKHKEIISAIDDLDCPVFFVPGNHDGDLLGLRRINNMRVVWGSYLYEDGGKTVAICHGHRYDDISEPVSKLASWITTIADRVALWVLGPGASVQRSLRRSLANMGSKDKYAGPIAEAAVADLGADVVVLGHTHLPDAGTRIANSLYVNSGDFGPDHLSWIEIADGIPTLRMS